MFRFMKNCHGHTSADTVAGVCFGDSDTLTGLAIGNVIFQVENNLGENSSEAKYNHALIDTAAAFPETSVHTETMLRCLCGGVGGVMLLIDVWLQDISLKT